MQTILGINGITGKGIAEILINKGIPVRGVSRRPYPGPWTHVQADVLNPESLQKAVAGSEVVYACFGLEYDIKIWRRDWPVAISNVLDACMAAGAKLVFIDNVYMYGKVTGVMTEESPIRPSSEKGKVRAQVAALILDAFQRRGLKGCIARAADFYGPDCEKSMITETVFKNLAVGKTAQWLGSLDKVHSFTFIPDLCKAAVTLGNSDTANGQVWHLPTHPHPLTGRQWIALIAREMGKPAKSMVLGGFLLRILGLFIPILKEIREMMYQYEADYVFSSAKYEQVFGDVPPTPYEEGIRQTALFYKGAKV